MFYRLKLAFLRHPKGSYLWRYWMAWRGMEPGNYADLPRFVQQYASGSSFADIGCMWGVNGRYSFVAEDAGATSIKGIDVFGPTPEFEDEVRSRNSKVEFVLGDVCSEETIDEIGAADVVLCAGVLYHHPSPYELLVALRRICRKTLILRTFAIPENKRLRNSAIFFPHLTEPNRDLWNLQRQGLVEQLGITCDFDPAEGYGNYFWGMTPSCLRSLLKVAGFAVIEQSPEPFAQTFICKPVGQPLGHEVPEVDQARKIAADISEQGIARSA